MKNIPSGKNLDLPLELHAGTVIFSQGESCKYLYLVKSGEVNLLKDNGEKLSLVNLCKQKEILNEVSVLTNKPVEFSAIAKTDVELVLVDQKDILSVFKNGPSWIPEMFETLCERLKSTEEIIIEHNLTAHDQHPELVLSKEDEQKYLRLLSVYTQENSQ